MEQNGHQRRRQRRDDSSSSSRQLQHCCCRRVPPSPPPFRTFFEQHINFQWKFVAPLAILLLLLFVAVASAEEEGEMAKVGQKLDQVGKEMSDAADQLIKTESGQLWCPSPALPIANACPSASVFHFYRCCGQFNKECCLKLQTWTFVALVAIAVIVCALMLLAILRCVFCRRK